MHKRKNPADNGVSSDYESLTVTIPSTQTGNENGYDEKSVVAVARTTSKSLKIHSFININLLITKIKKIALLPTTEQQTIYKQMVKQTITEKKNGKRNKLQE